MLTAAHRETLARDGLVRLPGAFAETAAMEAAVWSFLVRQGIVRDDRTSWPEGFVSHLRSLRPKPVFAPIGGETIRAALDQILGQGRWKPPAHWGQFLVTFPGGPHHTIWHLDYPWLEPLEPLRGVMVWSFLNRVPSRAGGPLIVAGSHRLAARFAAARPRVASEKAAVSRVAFCHSHAWLKAATRSVAPAQEYAEEVDVDGLPARVVELTGEPGDLVLAHPLILHSPAPNQSDGPRMMRIARLRRSPSLDSPCAAPPADLA